MAIEIEPTFCTHGDLCLNDECLRARILERAAALALSMDTPCADEVTTEQARAIKRRNAAVARAMPTERDLSAQLPEGYDIKVVVSIDVLRQSLKDAEESGALAIGFGFADVPDDRPYTGPGRVGR